MNGMAKVLPCLRSFYNRTALFSLLSQLVADSEPGANHGHVYRA